MMGVSAVKDDAGEAAFAGGEGRPGGRHAPHLPLVLAQLNLGSLGSVYHGFALEQIIFIIILCTYVSISYHRC